VHALRWGVYFERKRLFAENLPKWLAAHDVVWFTESFHFLLQRFRGAGIKTSLYFGRANHTRRVLETVQRAARATAAAGKLLVFSTAMDIDTPLLLATPPKHDY